MYMKSLLKTLIVVVLFVSAIIIGSYLAETDYNYEVKKCSELTVSNYDFDFRFYFVSS